MQKVVVQYNNSTNKQVNFKLYIGIGICSSAAMLFDFLINAFFSMIVHIQLFK